MGLDDVVGVWEVAQLVRHDTPGVGEPEVRGRSLEVIRELLSAGLVDVGGNGDGFQPWGLGTDAALARIEERWREIDGPLGLGETGAWLRVTERGAKLGREFEPMFLDGEDDD